MVPMYINIFYVRKYILCTYIHFMYVNTFYVRKYKYIREPREMETSWSNLFPVWTELKIALGLKKARASFRNTIVATIFLLFPGTERAASETRGKKDCQHNHIPFDL